MGNTVVTRGSVGPHSTGGEKLPLSIQLSKMGKPGQLLSGSLRLSPAQTVIACFYGQNKLKSLHDDSCSLNSG